MQLRFKKKTKQEYLFSHILFLVTYSLHCLCSHWSRLSMKAWTSKCPTLPFWLFVAPFTLQWFLWIIENSQFVRVISIWLRMRNSHGEVWVLFHYSWFRLHLFRTRYHFYFITRNQNSLQAEWKPGRIIWHERPMICAVLQRKKKSLYLYKSQLMKRWLTKCNVLELWDNSVHRRHHHYYYYYYCVVRVVFWVQHLHQCNCIQAIYIQHWLHALTS